MKSERIGVRRGGLRFSRIDSSRSRVHPIMLIPQEHGIANSTGHSQDFRIKSSSPMISYASILFPWLAAVGVGAERSAPPVLSERPSANRSPFTADDAESLPESDWVRDIFGLWTVLPDDLDRCVDDFLPQLARGQGERVDRFRVAAATAPGKMVLGRKVDRAADHLRSKRIRDALDEYIAARFTLENGTYKIRDDQTRFRQTVHDETARYDADLAALSPILREITHKLAGESDSERSLQDLLSKEEGPHWLYSMMVRPILRPDPARQSLQRKFTENDFGRYEIPKVYRQAAQQQLDDTRSEIARFSRLARQAAKLTENLNDRDTLEAGLMSASVDPVFLGLRYKECLRMNGNPSPDQAEALVVAELTDMVGTLRNNERGTASRLDSIAQKLSRYEEVKASLEPIRASAGRFASLIEPGDALHEGWRSALLTETAFLDSAMSAPATLDPVQVLLNQTALGVGLQKGEDGTYRVIRHVETHMEDLVARLEASGRGQQQLFAWIDEFASKIEDAEVRKRLKGFAGKHTIAMALRSSLLRARLDGFQEWVDQLFVQSGQEFVLREAARPKLEAILAEIDSERRPGETPPLEINLSEVEFSADRLNLFRSSSFYTKRTSAGELPYWMEYDDHFAARLFHVFEWETYRSTDLESFKKMLYSRRPALRELANTHHRFIVVIAKTPAWLSNSNDKTPIQPTWENRHAHSPKSMADWRELVRVTAEFFKEFDPVERYYEFWNEPDLGFWLEGGEEYLKLYKETASAIKKADPRARVGGAAVNQWDGKLKSSSAREPLNHLLIREAEERNLPLDFLSWHHFGGRPHELREAAASFRQALADRSLNPVPEFYVSEWNNSSGVRDSRRAAVGLAEHFLTMHESGVDMQTICWEDIEAKPNPSEYAPYGLITQLGRKKPEYYAYRFFDRLSRDLTGVGVVRRRDDSTVCLIGRKSDGSFDLLFWQAGPDEALSAAVASLKTSGLSAADIGKYGGTSQLERAVRNGRAASDRHRDAFALARKVYQERSTAVRNQSVRILGHSGVEVTLAQSVKFALEPKRVATEGDLLSFELPQYELLWVRVRPRK